RILLGGVDIRELPLAELRARMAIVFQDPVLFHGSIGDNVSMAAPDASAEAVDAAVSGARVASIVPDVLAMEVSDRGARLSGGEKQRVAIARAMLKDAPILILDEATSALDSEVEAAIQENLYRLMEGKTVIAIAHRLSTIAAMDRLVVMDNGRIVEEGTHDALVAKGGLYAQLWLRQSGGFLLEDDPHAEAAAMRGKEVAAAMEGQAAE
ncbi:ATP-binding cassette domain-containing protein, partial [Rhizobiaceae sp. 2RAB30]